MGSRLDRRRVLQLASSGVLAWSLGPLVAGCTRISRARAGELSDAWERARMHDRPLLVLLADSRHPSDRGMAWSAYLDLASDVAMAELSSCELAFATMEQVRAVLPFVPIDGPDLRQALLVEPNDGAIAEIPAVRPVPDGSVLGKTEEPEPLREWVLRMETAMHAVFAASPSWRRSASNADVHVAAEALRRRMREEAPAGGIWAKDFGFCGRIEFEDGTAIPWEDVAIYCGMAFGTEKGRRFLWLYSMRGS